VHDTLGYVRVSTEQQATEQKTSLTDQRRLIVDKARAMGRVLEAAAIFEDAGVSGATAEGRPAFMAMLRYCESNPRPAKAIGMIFVLNDSRFGRFDDPEEATHWRFVLKRLGWRVRFVEGDEVEDTFARGVIRFIGSAQASEYRANLKRTAKRAARSTAEKGLWQQEAPLGYRRLATRTDGAQRVLEIGQRKADDEVSRLTLGPEEEVEAIRTMFDGYANRHLSLGMLMTDMASRFPINQSGSWCATRIRRSSRASCTRPCRTAWPPTSARLRRHAAATRSLA
jgi:DNA invertase Pin-like site-specific DNA recombinase